MHDDDLRNFFDEDAYKELLDTYAEEDSRKERERARREQQAKAPSTQPSRKTPPAKKAPASRSTQSPREHTRPVPVSHHTPRPVPSPKHDEPHPVRKTEGFKLEIKGLDEEFNTPPHKNARRRPTRLTLRQSRSKTRRPTVTNMRTRSQKPAHFRAFRKSSKNAIKSKNPPKKHLSKKQLRRARAVP